MLHTHQHGYGQWGSAEAWKCPQCVHYMMYCMQRYFVSLLYPHLARAHTSDMACVDNQQGGDHNPDSPHHQNRYVVIWGSGSMEMARVRSLHDIFHSKVIQIIVIATQGKGAHL